MREWEYVHKREQGKKEKRQRGRAEEGQGKIKSQKYYSETSIFVIKLYQRLENSIIML